MTGSTHVTPEVQRYVGEVHARAAGGDAKATEEFEWVVDMLDRISTGEENGHHPLTDKSHLMGGDLRDCTATEFTPGDETAKVGSHRIVWRQLPEQQPGAGPAREIIFAGPRHQAPDFYQQTLQVLDRAPDQQQPELDEPFGQPAYTGQKGLPSRSAALEAQRAAALARTGVTPLAKSKPLDLASFGRRGPAAASTGRTTGLGGPSKE